MTTLDENPAASVFEAAGFRLASPRTGARLEQPLKAGGDRAEDAVEIRALTLAIRGGDAAAFARFHDLYSFRLYRFLLVLARGDENTAREVCQTALTKLARRFGVFDDDRMLWAWLCALARNCFLDHCRARQRRNRFVPLEEMSASTAGIETSMDPLSEILREALAALGPEKRELLQAAYVDGRPLQELADAAGLTYKSVKSRLARLRLKLKARLLNDLRHENES